MHRLSNKVTHEKYIVLVVKFYLLYATGHAGEPGRQLGQGHEGVLLGHY